MRLLIRCVCAMLVALGLTPTADAKAVKLRELFEMSAVKGRIKVDVVLAAFTESLSQEIEVVDLPGKTTLGYRPLFFRLQNERQIQDGDEQVKIVTRFELREGYLNLQQQQTRGGKTEVVVLLQGMDAAQGDSRSFELRPGEVRLSLVTIENRMRTASESVSAASWEELRRKHPKLIVKAHAMLRDIQAQDLFAPDPRKAAAVLSDDPAEPTAEFRAKIEQLVAQLADSAAAKRDAAEKELKALGAAAVAVLETIDAGKLDPEQQQRVAKLIAAVPQVSPVEKAALRDDPMFLLDCLYLEDSQLRQAALKKLSKVAGREIRIDLDAELADRAVQIEAARAEIGK